MQADSPELEVWHVAQELARGGAGVTECKERIPGAEGRPEGLVCPGHHTLELAFTDPKERGRGEALLTGFAAPRERPGLGEEPAHRVPGSL